MTRAELTPLRFDSLTCEILEHAAARLQIRVTVSVATSRAHAAPRRGCAAAHSGKLWYLEINDRNWFERMVNFTAAREKNVIQFTNHVEK